MYKLMFSKFARICKHHQLIRIAMLMLNDESPTKREHEPSTLYLDSWAVWLALPAFWCQLQPATARRSPCVDLSSKDSNGKNHRLIYSMLSYKSYTLIRCSVMSIWTYVWVCVCVNLCIYKSTQFYSLVMYIKTTSSSTHPRTLHHTHLLSATWALWEFFCSETLEKHHWSPNHIAWPMYSTVTSVPLNKRHGQCKNMGLHLDVCREGCGHTNSMTWFWKGQHSWLQLLLPGTCWAAWVQRETRCQALSTLSLKPGLVMERSIHKVEMIWKWHECHFPNRIFKKHLTIYLKYLVEKGKIKIDKGIYEIIWGIHDMTKYGIRYEWGKHGEENVMNMWEE